MQAFQRLAQALSFGGQACDIGLQFRVAAFQVAVFPLQGVDIEPLAGHGCGTNTMMPATTAAWARHTQRGTFRKEKKGAAVRGSGAEGATSGSPLTGVRRIGPR